MRRATFFFFTLLSFSYALPSLAAGVGVDGTLYDLSGNPLASTQVKLQDGQGVIVKTVTSDAHGHYQFTDVPAGSYVLLATQNDAVLGSTLLTTTSVDAHKDLKLADSQTFDLLPVFEPAGSRVFGLCSVAA